MSETDEDGYYRQSHHGLLPPPDRPRLVLVPGELPVHLLGLHLRELGRGVRG